MTAFRVRFSARIASMSSANSDYSAGRITDFTRS
jgi:hypothetical protein